MGVLELNYELAMVDATARVNGNFHARFDASINFPSPTLENESSDRRVMADLLKEYWTAIHPSLVGLAENGIEWFVHFQPYQGYPNGEAEHILKPFNWIGSSACSIKIQWTKAHESGSSFQIWPNLTIWLYSAPKMSTGKETLRIPFPLSRFFPSLLITYLKIPFCTSIFFLLI